MFSIIVLKNKNQIGSYVLVSFYNNTIFSIDKKMYCGFGIIVDTTTD